MEFTVSTFGFKSAVLIVTSRDGLHAPTEVKYVIITNPCITKIMVDSHCEILWSDNKGAGLGRHPTESYGSGIYYPQNQVILAQQRLMYMILILWIKKSLTTGTKLKSRDFSPAYTFNIQYDGATIFFIL